MIYKMKKMVFAREKDIKTKQQQQQMKTDFRVVNLLES